MYCGDAYGQCAFSKAKSPGEGLPVLVVDEEIYRLLPALLIATVDKFAQLPWKGETQMLFGRVEKRCERHGFRAAAVRRHSDEQKRVEKETTMKRSILILGIAAVGLVLWLVVKYIPMDATIQRFLVIAVIILLVLWFLTKTPIWDALLSIRV